MRSILVRYGEIAIKGNNRAEFLRTLRRSIRRFIVARGIVFGDVIEHGSRIVIREVATEVDLRSLFGIESYSYCSVCPATFEGITTEIRNHMREIQNPFRVTCRRLTKTIPLSSQTIARDIGEFIQECTGYGVDLTNYVTDVGIELIEGSAYIFTQKTQGAGGLPVGSGGTVAVMVDRNEDIVAVWKMLGRGCYVYACTDTVTPRDIPGVRWLNRNAWFCPPRSVRAVVVPDTLETYKKYESFLFIFRPLIAYTQEEIRSCYQLLPV